MKKVIDNIYAFALKLPFPATPELTLYYIDGPTPAIIDTGLGDRASMKAIDSALGEIGKGITDISRIINTHEHIEHFSGNNAIRKISNASVTTSVKTARVIEHYHDITLGKEQKLRHESPGMHKRLGNLISYHLTVNDAEVDTPVSDGDIIDLGSVRLRVIETPGHADGHICLYDEDRKILFTGDHLITTGSTFVGYFWRDFSPEDIIRNFNDNTGPGNIALYIDALKKLQKLDLDMIFPSHGMPVSDPYELIARGIKGKEEREHLFLTILEKEKVLDLETLTAKAYNETHSNFLQQGAALGYLERLAKSGKIKVDADGETLKFKI